MKTFDKVVKKTPYFSIYSLTTFMEGIIAFFLIFQIPSENENAWLFGYSKIRVLLGGSVFIFSLIFLSLSVLSLVVKRTTFPPLKRITDNIKKPASIQVIFISCIFFAVFGLIFIFVLLVKPSFLHFNTIWYLFQKTYSLFILGILTFGQTALLIWLYQSEEMKSDNFWDKNLVARTILLLCVFALSLFHWLVFITQDGFFTLIDGWYWQYHVKPFKLTDLLFIPYFLISIVGGSFIYKTGRFKGIYLIALIVLGYFLQIGMGFVEGEGFSSLARKFMESGHSHYATHASDDPIFLDALRIYEGTYTTNFILGTKPPGGLAFYMIVQKISNLVNPVDSYIARYERLVIFASYFFPLLAALAAILLIYFAKLVDYKSEIVLFCLFFFFTPNFILIVLQLDQFLYPAMFLLGLVLTFRIIQSTSFISSLLLGAYFYICLYMSFSLLPLISLCALWVGVDYLFFAKKRDLKSYLIVLGGVVLGFLILYALFLVALNYNALERYQNALEWHKTIKLYRSDVRGILISAIINNLEFLLWCGSPILVLSLTYLYQAVVRILKNQASRLDWFGLAFIVNYLLLNLIGQTRSEVGRLWFFLVPLIALLAGVQFEKLFSKNHRLLSFLLAIQLITVYVTFRFQDFY